MGNARANQNLSQKRPGQAWFVDIACSADKTSKPQLTARDKGEQCSGRRKTGKSFFTGKTAHLSGLEFLVFRVLRSCKHYQHFSREHQMIAGNKVMKATRTSVPTMHKPHTWRLMCSTPVMLPAIAATVVGILAAGCATPPPPPVPPAPDPVAQRIDDALTKAASLPTFTRGAERTVPRAVVEGQSITASFHGDAAVLLKALATARGKEFRILGPRPHLPLIVQVNADAVPLEELLRDVGFQFAQRADLVLTDGAIEIRHRGNR
jgi:hypothetical protein